MKAMENAFDRTRMLIGSEAVERLASFHIAVFGLGGVGGYAVEALARAGIGCFTVVDNDTVSVTNLNRQILATVDTVGRLKAEVARERILSINPSATVNARTDFFSPDTAFNFDFSSFDFVVDAIDTVTGKIELAVCCKNAGVPLISCMGTGNKLDPTLFEVADISKTSVCPLARVMRRELKARGITSLKVVYSREKPLRPTKQPDSTAHEPETLLTSPPSLPGARAKEIPASISFVPSVAGLILAGEVIKDLIKS